MAMFNSCGRTAFRTGAFTAGLMAMRISPSFAGTPPSTNQLQDITVFEDQLYGTWSGGDIIAPSSRLPIDTSQTLNGLPCLRFETQGPTQNWWTVILAGVDWRSYSVEYYRLGGLLEFNVKGASGGEQFKIGFTDIDPARSPLESTVWGRSASFFQVTTEWQHVAIPLEALMTEDVTTPIGQFNPRQLRSIRFGEAYAGAYAKTFWLNDVKITSPAGEPSSPAIRVNQIGYLPLAEKYAYVADFPERLQADTGTTFRVRRASDGALVRTGQLTLVNTHERFVSGEKVLKADFTSVFQPGQYYLEVDAPGIAASPQFQIDWNLYRPALRDAQRYFYYQRQGIAIAEPFAEGFARGLGHPGDLNAKFRSSGALRDISKGWYDAGDYGKYTPFAAGPIADLLDAQELFPMVFGDSNNIPESGNGIPDILDEVRWELDWLRKMQDGASGGFYHLVYPNNCPSSGSCRPEDITEQRYIEDLMGGVGNVRPTAGTAKAVAALARAARAFRSLDRVYADNLLASAIAGWGYLLANPNNIEAKGFNGAQSTDDQERLWAAAELFRTTEGTEYGNYFLARYANYAPLWTSTTDNASSVAMRAFLAYNRSPRADHQARRWFRERFLDWREAQLSRTSTTWRNFLDDGSGDFGSDYYWGSNAVTLQTLGVIALGDCAVGNLLDLELVDVARAQLNYVAGINPLRKSYITGHGADSPQRLFSHIYSSDDISALPPGILVEGPNQYQGSRYSRFHGKCYADTNTDYTVSEHAIYYNATLTFALALVDATRWIPNLH